MSRIQSTEDTSAGHSQALYDFMRRLTTISELRCDGPGSPFSGEIQMRGRRGRSSSEPGNREVERDLLLRYIASGDGGGLAWLDAREVCLEDVADERLCGRVVLWAVPRRRLTSRGSSEGKSGLDLRFLGLEGLDRGDEPADDAGEA